MTIFEMLANITTDPDDLPWVQQCRRHALRTLVDLTSQDVLDLAYQQFQKDCQHNKPVESEHRLRELYNDYGLKISDLSMLPHGFRDKVWADSSLPSCLNASFFQNACLITVPSNLAITESMSLFDLDFGSLGFSLLVVYQKKGSNIRLVNGCSGGGGKGNHLLMRCPRIVFFLEAGSQLDLASFHHWMNDPNKSPFWNQESLSFYLEDATASCQWLDVHVGSPQSASDIAIDGGRFSLTSLWFNTPSPPVQIRDSGTTAFTQRLWRQTLGWSPKQEPVSFQNHRHRFLNTFNLDAGIRETIEWREEFGDCLSALPSEFQVEWLRALGTS